MTVGMTAANVALYTATILIIMQNMAYFYGLEQFEMNEKKSLSNTEVRHEHR